MRIPLEAINLDSAKAELEKKRTEKGSGILHQPGHRPKFDALVVEYESAAEFLAKKPGTRENESQALKRWTKQLGGLRIDWIKTSHMVDFRNVRRGAGVCARTINLDVTAFNNAMAYAKTKGWLNSPPRLTKLAEARPPRRPLLTPENIQKLLECCRPEVTKNARQVSFFLRFLALSGAREQESLKTRKIDVILEGRKLVVGALGDTKNREGRVVDMSDELFSLLEELLGALPPDTQFLFPSSQRGKRDAPAKTLRESFKLVRAAADLPWVGFHDFRHFFCSTCVMAGIDFMTIASWVGHKDGGILIGKVYGHIADEHKRLAAARLSILGV